MQLQRCATQLVVVLSGMMNKNASSQRKKSSTIGSRVIRRPRVSLISNFPTTTNCSTCLAKIVQWKAGPRLLRTLGQTILLGTKHLSLTLCRIRTSSQCTVRD
uniref:Uncharacterized protein n=1 Tax=Cucumis melo TaxID=3656 RepID=A0A9I9E9Y1_CUCME